jgi:hypothetical protein
MSIPKDGSAITHPWRLFAPAQHPVRERFVDDLKREPHHQNNGVSRQEAVGAMVRKTYATTIPDPPKFQLTQRDWDYLEEAAACHFSTAMRAKVENDCQEYILQYVFERLGRTPGFLFDLCDQVRGSSRALARALRRLNRATQKNDKALVQQINQFIATHTPQCCSLQALQQLAILILVAIANERINTRKSAPARTHADAVVRAITDLAQIRGRYTECVYQEIDERLEELGQVATDLGRLIDQLDELSRIAGDVKQWMTSALGNKGPPSYDALRNLVWVLADTFEEAGYGSAAIFDDLSDTEWSPFAQWLKELILMLPRGSEGEFQYWLKDLKEQFGDELDLEHEPFTANPIRFAKDVLEHRASRKQGWRGGKKEPSSSRSAISCSD